MGTLVLVRHGQASMFSDDYDRLSPIGEVQARLLGEHWVRSGVTFDQVVTGPRKRQRDTARLAGEAFLAAGKPYPEPVLVEHFDEMHAEELLRTKLPALTLQHEELRALVTDTSDGGSGPGALKRFQRIFERVMQLWIAGQIDAPEIESWRAFCERVATGVGNLRAPDASRRERGARIAAFTSAGTISAAMRHALDLGDQKMLDLAGVVRNASITEFAFSSTRITLTQFNATPHLVDPAHLTHR